MSVGVAEVPALRLKLISQGRVLWKVSAAAQGLREGAGGSRFYRAGAELAEGMSPSCL